MELFGSSGVRGVVDDDLGPGFVLRVAAAAGSFWGVERAAVARDTRHTGSMLASAAAAGLAGAGADVDRLGVAPTPAVQVHCEREGVPALVVTASHNPPEYNGVKLVGADGVELQRSALEAVEERVLADDGADDGAATWDETGQVRSVEGVCERYREQLLAAADREAVADADLTVALDPGHGAGALTSPEFFRELGCEVVTVHAQPDGRFPGREPEPVAANLGDLRDLVVAADADVGIAHDGDADRAIFVDETGAHVEGDATLAALAAAELAAGDTAVSAVNVSQRLVDVCDDVGATLELTPIGSTYIITAVRELQADDARVAVAGEGNGGIFFPDYRLARDGAYTATRLLELLGDRTVSELVAPYGGYHNVRTNVEYGTEAEREAMLWAARELADEADADLTTTDGYRLDHGDAWVLVRPSGTEPLVRVYAEATDRGRAEELATDAERALRDAREDA
jgi:phosphomannomutase/phosphoglucomutase